MSDDGVVHLTRTIPVPRSVSAHAQAVLGMTNMFSASTGAPPSAADPVEWREHVDALNATIVSTSGAPTPDGPSVSTMSVGTLPVHVLTPAGLEIGDDTPIHLDIHGGGFVYGAGEACVAMAIGAVKRSHMLTWSVDYRVPPEHPYPAPLDDCVTVYRALLEQRDPSRIVVGGASAGGNLAAALMLRLRAEGLPMPAALVLLTPEVDLTESGDSFETNLGLDPVLTRRLTDSIEMYAAGHDLTDPFLSPLFGDLAGFPPTLLQTGTRDLFLSNTVLMHRALRRAGVEAELHVFEAMPHGGFFGAPEDAELAHEIREFISRHVA